MRSRRSEAFIRRSRANNCAPANRRSTLQSDGSDSSAPKAFRVAADRAFPDVARSLSFVVSRHANYETLGVMCHIDMMKTLLLTFSLCVLTAFAGETNKLTTYIGKFEQPFPGPQSYRDTDSGIIFYVE